MSNSSAESPVDTNNSKIKTDIDADLEEKDVETLLHEIGCLKSIMRTCEPSS
ncbi:MAG: hypothetical protein R2741_06115 [Methanolobus sp.]